MIPVKDIKIPEIFHKKTKVPKNNIGFSNHTQSFTTLYYLDVESSLVENLKIGWKQIKTDLTLENGWKWLKTVKNGHKQRKQSTSV